MEGPAWYLHIIEVTVITPVEGCSISVTYTTKGLKLYQTVEAPAYYWGYHHNTSWGLQHTGQPHIDSIIDRWHNRQQLIGSMLTARRISYSFLDGAVNTSVKYIHCRIRATYICGCTMYNVQCTYIVYIHCRMGATHICGCTMYSVQCTYSGKYHRGWIMRVGRGGGDEQTGADLLDPYLCICLYLCICIYVCIFVFVSVFVLAPVSSRCV